MIEQSNNWQEAILDSADFTIISMDLHGTIVSCNAGTLNKLGYTADEIIGKSPLVFHDSIEVEQRVQQLSQELHCSIAPEEIITIKTSKGIVPDESDWTHICKDGKRFISHVSVTAIHDESGGVVGFLKIGKDVTQQREMEKALHETESTFHAFMDNSPAISFIKDAQGRYVYVNKQFLTIVNLSCDEIIGKTVCDLLSPDVAIPMREHDETILENNESRSFEETIPLPDGTSSTWLTFRFPLTDRADNKLVGGVSIDITQRHYYEKQLEDYQLRLEGAIAQLESVASTDALSGLKNKGAFLLRLDEEISRATRYNMPLSLLILDVDKFKEYNDAFGHPAGDNVLKTIARLMQEHARPGDYVARIGGEEFAIIFSNTPIQGAYVVGERLRRAVENTHWTSRPVTISVGVAETSPEINDRNALYEATDHALYHAKRTGRNLVAQDSN